MSRNPDHGQRRIFGGGESQPTAGSAVYVRPLLNPNDQAVAESVAATTYRTFAGPVGENPHWSYHGYCSQAGGAGSALKFYASNLPDPDPTDATHWGSALHTVAIDATGAFQATLTSEGYRWFKAEATIASGTAKFWAYVRANGVDEI